MHNDENERVCVVLKGELTIYTEDDEATLTKHDAAQLKTWEEHRVETLATS